MPLYEYSCHQCGEVFEVMQKFADEPLATHEGCGGAVERLVSAPSFQFKGTGWYVTDYGKNGKVPPSEPKAKAEAKSDTKSESKTESKPAASTPPASKSD